MDINEIKEKVKSVKTYEEAKAILTEEELIYYIAYVESDYEVIDEDVPVLISMFKSVSEQNYSIRHALAIFDLAKEVLMVVGRFKY